VSELNLRSVIDEIALEVSELAGAEQTPAGLQQAIGDAALKHIKRLIEQCALKDSTEIDRVTEAIVRGVLLRLTQIAEGGGQIGNT
jgi:hypothetical protein